MNGIFGCNSCTWVLILVIIFLLSQNGGSCGCNECGCNGCGLRGDNTRSCGNNCGCGNGCGFDNSCGCDSVPSYQSCGCRQ